MKQESQVRFEQGSQCLGRFPYGSLFPVSGGPNRLIPRERGEEVLLEKGPLSKPGVDRKLGPEPSTLHLARQHGPIDFRSCPHTVLNACADNGALSGRRLIDGQFSQALVIFKILRDVPIEMGVSTSATSSGCPCGCRSAAW